MNYVMLGCVCLRVSMALTTFQEEAQIVSGRILGALQKNGAEGEDGLSLLEVSSANRLPIETSMLLTQVEAAAARSISSTEMDNVSLDVLVGVTEDIMRIVLPSITEQHNISQEAIHSTWRKIGNCTDTMISELPQAKTLEDIMTGKRGNHSSCRDEQTGSSSDSGDICDKLWAFITDLPADGSDLIRPSCESDMAPEPTAGVDHFLTKLITFGETKLPIYNDLVRDCEEVTDNHTDLEALCQRKQREFENSFCTWHADVVRICTEETACRDREIQFYNQTQIDQQKLKSQLVNEYSSLMKITCFLKVITDHQHAGASVDTQAADLQACRVLEPNTDSLNLDEPAVEPPATVCPLHTVDIHPGNAQWLSQEYGGKTWTSFVTEQSVSVCV